MKRLPLFHRRAHRVIRYNINELNQYNAKAIKSIKELIENMYLAGAISKRYSLYYYTELTNKITLINDRESLIANEKYEKRFREKMLQYDMKTNL
jgi:hypothetical protein